MFFFVSLPWTKFKNKTKQKTKEKRPFSFQLTKPNWSDMKKRPRPADWTESKQKSNAIKWKEIRKENSCGHFRRNNVQGPSLAKVATLPSSNELTLSELRHHVDSDRSVFIFCIKKNGMNKCNRAYGNKKIMAIRFHTWSFFFKNIKLNGRVPKKN